MSGGGVVVVVGLFVSGLVVLVFLDCCAQLCNMPLIRLTRSSRLAGGRQFACSLAGSFFSLVHSVGRFEFCLAFALQMDFFATQSDS